MEGETNGGVEDVLVSGRRRRCGGEAEERGDQWLAEERRRWVGFALERTA